MDKQSQQINNHIKKIRWWGLAMILLMAIPIAAGGIGGYYWYAHRNAAKQQQQAEQTNALQRATALSSKGDCAQARGQLEKLLSDSDLKDPAIKAQTQLRLGECLLTLREYAGAIVQLQPAVKAFKSLKDTTHQTEAQLLLTKATTEKINHEPSTRGDKQPTRTYDGAKTL